MPFPWGQPFIDLSFTCPHCSTTYYNENNRVAVCTCPASEQERIEQRERDAAFQRSQRAAQLVDFNEIRQQRKMRTNR